jgi:hypothetical protein
MSVENVIFTSCCQALLSLAALRSMSSFVPWYEVKGVSVEARKMPFCAIRRWCSSLRAMPCSIDQRPASIARLAPSGVWTWPATLSPPFAASAMNSFISSTV